MLRNHAIALVLWLCRTFDIVPLDEARIQMSDEAKMRSHRWEGFYRETGGLSDMLDNIRSDYLAGMGRLEPGDVKAIEALAIGARVAEQLRAEVKTVIAAGKIADKREANTARMAARPLRKSI